MRRLRRTRVAGGTVRDIRGSGRLVRERKSATVEIRRASDEPTGPAQVEVQRDVGMSAPVAPAAEPVRDDALRELRSDASESPSRRESAAGDVEWRYAAGFGRSG